MKEENHKFKKKYSPTEKTLCVKSLILQTIIWFNDRISCDFLQVLTGIPSRARVALSYERGTENGILKFYSKRKSYIEDKPGTRNLSDSTRIVYP